MLSDAHNVLSDNETRQIYDDRLSLSRSVHSPYKISNIKRSFFIFLDNFSSRILLFFAKIRKGLWREELEDFQEFINSLSIWQVKHNTFLIYKSFSLLPSWGDRLLLLGEYAWKLRIKILTAISIYLGFRSMFQTSFGKEVDNYYYDNL